MRTQGDLRLYRLHGYLLHVIGYWKQEKDFGVIKGSVPRNRSLFQFNDRQVKYIPDSHLRVVTPGEIYRSCWQEMKNEGEGEGEADISFPEEESTIVNCRSPEISLISNSDGKDNDSV